MFDISMFVSLIPHTVVVLISIVGIAIKTENRLTRLETKLEFIQAMIFQGTKIIIPKKGEKENGRENQNT